jgi:hypothetical protein
MLFSRFVSLEINCNVTDAWVSNHSVFVLVTWGMTVDAFTSASFLLSKRAGFHGQEGVILIQLPHQGHAYKNARCVGRLESNKELDYCMYPF